MVMIFFSDDLLMVYMVVYCLIAAYCLVCLFSPWLQTALPPLARQARTTSILVLLCWQLAAFWMCSPFTIMVCVVVIIDFIPLIMYRSKT